MKKQLLFLIMLMIFVISACSNDEVSENETSSEDNPVTVNKEGMPIVDEKIELELFTAKSATNVDYDWNDLLVWNEYEDLTNIDVNWAEQVQVDGLEEKRNLALASNSLPDAFYAADLSNTDILRYGKQGVFLELNDLIDEYAPNLKAILEESPELKKGMTFPDGNIYSLPSLRDEEFLSIRIGARPFINQEWLDALGMEMPATLDEYYEYLKAVKTEDPNGNGEADEIPYGGVNMDDLIGWLQGSFGIGNRGPGYIDVNPENQDEIRFIAITEGYRDLLSFVHKLFDEELIQQNIFSIEWGQFMSTATEGVYGSTVFYAPEVTLGGDVGSNYSGISALEGPNGDKMYSSVQSSLYNNGGFVITSENEHPEATVRWLDYFYSDEGARLLYMGVEGETYNETENGYEYVEKITNSEEGLTMNQEISKYIPWVGVNPPGIVKQEYFSGSESSPQSLEAAANIEPYIPEEIFPKFTYTEEENDLLQSAGVDIEKYVDEMRDKFITGDESLDDWDNYVETLNQMGLADYIEVQQSAYDRYRSN